MPERGFLVIILEVVSTIIRHLRDNAFVSLSFSSRMSVLLSQLKSVLRFDLLLIQVTRTCQ